MAAAVVTTVAVTMAAAGEVVAMVFGWGCPVLGLDLWNLWKEDFMVLVGFVSYLNL